MLNQYCEYNSDDENIPKFAMEVNAASIESMRARMSQIEEENKRILRLVAVQQDLIEEMRIQMQIEAKIMDTCCVKQADFNALREEIIQLKESLNQQERVIEGLEVRLSKKKDLPDDRPLFG